jgi:hypothetical protein
VDILLVVDHRYPLLVPLLVDKLLVDNPLVGILLVVDLLCLLVALRLVDRPQVDTLLVDSQLEGSFRLAGSRPGVGVVQVDTTLAHGSLQVRHLFGN